MLAVSHHNRRQVGVVSSHTKASTPGVYRPKVMPIKRRMEVPMITDNLITVALVAIMRIRFLLHINKDMNHMESHLNRINHRHHRVDTNSGEVDTEVDLIPSISGMVELEG